MKDVAIDNVAASQDVAVEDVAVNNVADKFDAVADDSCLVYMRL